MILYKKLEDKYYDLMDWLQKKAPVYEKLVYPLEARGIPSFPVLLTVFFLAGLLLGYGYYSAFVFRELFSVKVMNADGRPLEGALVRVFTDSKLAYENYTREGGEARFSVRLGEKNELSVSMEGYLQAKREFSGGETKVYLNELADPPSAVPEEERFDYFIASDKSALEEKYGEEYAGEVAGLMEELAETVSSEGIPARTVFEDEDLKELVNGHAPRYLLLVGGPNIMPFFEVETPLNEMPGMGFVASLDPVIPTDNPYGVLDSANYAGCKECYPDVAVGRLPDGFKEKSGSRLLVELLENTIAAHSRQPEKKAVTVVSEDAFGPHLGRGVFSELGNELWESPPEYSWDYSRGEEGDFEDLMRFVSGSPYLFLSLHGNAPPEEQAYTSSDGSGNYLVLSTSLPLTGEYEAKAVVSDACYGANPYRGEKESIPLHFLESGAVAFVGATTSALANKRVSRLDLEEAEILNLGACTALTYRVWMGLQKGERIGDAFLEGKRLMDAFNPADRLTALQFVLYGDPTLRV